jgi:ribosomal protein S18 acetylase RimI-like enzyme
MWHIRPYQPTDRSAVFQLCGDTAFFGEPLERCFDARELFLDYFATYYTDVVGDHLWVAKEDDGSIDGYIMGCPDTDAYGVWLRDHIQQLKRKFFTLRYRGLTPRTLKMIWGYWHLTGPYIDLSPYPAHFHINTRSDRRGQGIGSALMQHYLDQLRGEKIGGVHLETTSENKIAVPWYEELGFQLLVSWPTDLYRTSVGHSIDLLVYGLKL